MRPAAAIAGAYAHAYSIDADAEKAYRQETAEKSANNLARKEDRFGRRTHKGVAARARYATGERR
eukprot:gene28955-55619_t